MKLPPTPRFTGQIIGSVQHNKRTGQWRSHVRFDPPHLEPYTGEPRPTQKLAEADLASELREIRAAIAEMGYPAFLVPSDGKAN